MRILHVIGSLDQRSGGPLRAVLDLSARSHHHGLQSEVLGFGGLNVADNPIGREEIHCLPVERPARYCYAAALTPWLISNLRRFDAVILHGMWLYPNWAVSRECQKMGIPYFCFPHGMLEPWSVFRQGRWKALKKVAYWYLREKEILERSAAVFFTTAREREASTRTFPVHPRSYVVVPYGVDVGLRESEEPGVAAYPGKFALFLGRVHPGKNVKFLIEAWAEASVPREWQLVVAGPADPGDLRQLRRLALKLGIAPSISFAGMVTGVEKRRLLRTARWLLLPSSHENFGIVVLEALAAGCPVAMSDQVYLSDDFPADSEVLPLELDAWVAFLRHRMVDEAWREKRRQLDAAKLTPKFRFDNVARDWCALVRGLIAAQGRGSGCADPPQAGNGPEVGTAEYGATLKRRPERLSALLEGASGVGRIPEADAQLRARDSGHIKF